MFPDLAKLQSFGEAVELDELKQLIEFFAAAPQDAVWPAEDAPLGFAGVTYLERFRKQLVDSGRFEDDEIALIMRHARGYAGGMASADARRARNEPDDVAANEQFMQLPALGRFNIDLQPVQAGELTPWMQITPRAGSSFSHPKYGTVAFNRAMADEMVRNFRSGIYQDHIPVDAEHDTKLSGALGYFRELRVRTDGAVEARLELTNRGEALRAADAFRYFSPEFFRSWTDPATERTYNNVLIGGAFTTRPFFKDQHLAPLAASESYTTWQMGGTPVDRWQKDDKGALILDKDGNPQLTEEARKADEAAATKASEEAARAAGEAAVTAFRDEHKLDEQGKPVEAKGESEDDDKTKSFSEQYPDEAKRFQEIEAENARLRTAEQSRRFTDIVRGTGGSEDGARPFTGETERHVTHMVALAEKFGEDSDEFGHYVAREREHAEQLAKAGLFNERGSSGKGKAQSAEERAEAAVAELMKEDPDLSYGDAMDQVLSRNPELYGESLAEHEQSK